MIKAGESHQLHTFGVTWTFSTAASEKRRKTREPERRRVFMSGSEGAVFMFMESSHVCVRVEVLTHALREKREMIVWHWLHFHIIMAAHKLPVAGPLEGARPVGRVHAPAASPLERWWKLNYARTTRPCVSIKNGLGPTEFYTALICVNKFRPTLIIGHTISASECQRGWLRP